MPGHVPSKYRPGTSGLQWRCQRRTCTRVIPANEIACREHAALLPAWILQRHAAVATLNPMDQARRPVLLLADRAWRGAL